MIIANPLYDTAFKGLIQDPEVAKAIIGTLLETEVLDIHLEPTEHISPQRMEANIPKSIRLDYCATILNKNGEKQKILIEMQKTSGYRDIQRFRDYLALAGYGNKATQDNPLPIVTIYFLGFILDHVETPCLKVGHQYLCMLENKVLDTKERFVELLTHDSYVIQVPRIKVSEPLQTKLETILSVFEQKEIVQVEGVPALAYHHPINESYHKRMIDILSFITSDPKERAEMQNEEYWEDYEYHRSGKITRMEKEIAEQKNQLTEQKNELSKQKTQLTEHNKKLIETAKKLKSMGMSAEEIAEMTGVGEL